MSTNVVAFLLLNKFRDGCTLDNLIEAFDSIRQELEWSNKDLAFCGESIDIINHAVNDDDILSCLVMIIELLYVFRWIY